MRGLLGGIVGKSTTTADNPASWFVDWVRGGEETLSGVSVTPESAMALSAVWACVRIRSEDVGKLPCFLYRRLPNGGKERAVDHPLYSLIRDQPNPYQTAFEFRQLMQAWVDLRGNAYALKEFDVRGQVVALWPVNPLWVTVLRVPGTWELFYQLRIPGDLNNAMFRDPIPAEAIIHLRGLTLDGFCGVSPITYHRETIGLGIAAQKYGAAFFGNSARPDGILTVPTVLSPAAGDKLRADWEQKHKGVKNAKNLAIFDGGMKWEQVGMTNTDAEYILTRKFQKIEIFSLYRMPPHKAGDLERSTNNNIEHQGLEYVTDCLMTELVRWEQTLRRDLLTAKDRADGYFFEFLADALMRGDLASRYGAYAIARNWGWLNVDEIRDKENMNPVPNGKGKIFLQPLNMAEAGAPPPPAAPAAPPITPAAAKELVKHLQLLIARDEVEKDQPRVPAGSPEGGEWTDGEGGGSGSGDGSGGSSSGSHTADDFAKAGIQTTPEGIDLYNQTIKNVSPAEFKAGMVGGLSQSEMTIVPGRNGAMLVKTELMDANGEFVGQMNRNFPSNGTVEHSMFELEPGQQASGLAKQILAGQVALYEKAGISDVTMLANLDVGGYAWAKYGFVPVEGDNTLNFLRLQAKDLADDGKITGSVHDAINKLVASGDGKALWAIADSSAGKAMLLGTSYIAHLSLSDADAMKRFNAYVRK